MKVVDPKISASVGLDQVVCRIDVGFQSLCSMHVKLQPKVARRLQAAERLPLLSNLPWALKDGWWVNVPGVPNQGGDKQYVQIPRHPYFHTFTSIL